MVFKPTYIYIKTCNHCGLKYLGKSCRKTEKDVCKYTGSGKYWKLHLKKHNATYSTTIVNKFVKSEETECKVFCKLLSNFMNVKSNDKWANLKAEDGVDGGFDYHTEESKKKMSIARMGKKATEETKQKLRELNIGHKNSFYGKKHTKETKEKMKLRPKTWLGKTHTEETKQKLRKINIGRKHTEETKRKMREVKRKKMKKQPKIKCPHCNIEGGNSGMKRWHFDKCPHKK